MSGWYAWLYLAVCDVIIMHKTIINKHDMIFISHVLWRCQIHIVLPNNLPLHDDVIKRKNFPRYWPCVEKSPVSGEFPAQRPVTRSFDVFFDLRPNKQLSKQSWGWWFEMLSHSLWRHSNVITTVHECNKDTFELQPSLMRNHMASTFSAYKLNNPSLMQNHMARSFSA